MSSPLSYQNERESYRYPQTHVDYWPASPQAVAASRSKGIEDDAQDGGLFDGPDLEMKVTETQYQSSPILQQGDLHENVSMVIESLCATSCLSDLSVRPGSPDADDGASLYREVAALESLPESLPLPPLFRC